MKLARYLNGEHGRAAALARDIGKSAAFVSQMAVGLRPIPASLVPAIEAATRRVVRRWDMRPHDWHLLWPELIGADGAPSAAPAAQQAIRDAARMHVQDVCTDENRP